MNILGIETSCDDTSAAVLAGRSRVIVSRVSSQTDAHSPYGGVVPEIASRRHVEALPDIVADAVEASGLDWAAIDAVAVTRGPGLASSLMAGVVAARAIAYRLDRPLWTLNHLEAHIYSVFLDRTEPNPEEVAPALFLTVSGGHTNLVLMRGLHRYELLGSTMDDAAGEALDKAAKLLGLGYPGGPAIERAAVGADPQSVAFPRAGHNIKSSRFTGDLDPNYCFSFSGVKTALLYYIRKNPEILKDERHLRNVAASYQAAVVAALVERVRRAISRCDIRSLACAGGVMRNRQLRAALRGLASENGLPLLLAKPEYCTDNAAMVAGLGGALYEAGAEMPSSCAIEPRLPLA